MRTDKLKPSLKTYVGIDNGVTGSIGICNMYGATMEKTPIKKVLSYTKQKKNISRIDVPAFIDFLISMAMNQSPTLFCLLERPMVNPGRFQATVSALRALEATLIVLEHLKLPYQYIDSKEWQKVMLPKGLKGPELKTASHQIASQLFPHLESIINKQKDGDGILIAEYARRKGL